VSFFNIFAYLNLKIEYLQPECYVSDSESAYGIKYKATLMLPLILAALLVFFVMILHLTRWLLSYQGYVMDNDDDDDIDGSNSSLNLALMKSYMLLLDILYFTLADMSLELHDCSTVHGMPFFDIEPNRVCYQGWWYELLPLSIFGILFYTIGYPIFSFVIFSKRNAKLAIPIGQRTLWDRAVVACTFEKNGSYRSGFEFWRSVITARKLALVSVKMVHD
jgi:hypothetical protein